MIAIKDMKMPKSCVECKLCEYNEHIGYCCVANNGGKFTMTREEMKEKRLDDCPLVEIITCKDCKHWHDDGIITTCDKNIGHGFPKDHFCGDAERKE